MFICIAWKGVARANLGSIIGLGNSILVFSYRLCNWPREKRGREEKTWQLRPVDGAINNLEGKLTLRVTWVSPDSGVEVLFPRVLGNAIPVICFCSASPINNLSHVYRKCPTWSQRPFLNFKHISAKFHHLSQGTLMAGLGAELQTGGQSYHLWICSPHLWQPFMNLFDFYPAFLFFMVAQQTN